MAPLYFNGIQCITSYRFGKRREDFFIDLKDWYSIELFDIVNVEAISLKGVEDHICSSDILFEHVDVK